MVNALNYPIYSHAALVLVLNNKVTREEFLVIQMVDRIKLSRGNSTLN